MKTIGILGGMGPSATSYYYDTLCRLTRERLGGKSSPKIVLYSYDLAEVEEWLVAGEFDKLELDFTKTGDKLIAAGADMMMFATNTMHKYVDALSFHWGIPLLDVRPMVGMRLKADARKAPALLGTTYTMQMGFYLDDVARWAEADISVPEPSEQDELHAIIFDELVTGTCSDESKAKIIDLIAKLKARGADSVILGCAELGLLLDDENSPLPIYDSARIHCEEAIDMACSDWTL